MSGIADDVYKQQALEIHDLREANDRQLVDLVADLAFEKAAVQDFADRCYRENAQLKKARRGERGQA